MFNDFKFLSLDATKQKILRLKDIFDRLNLSSLEKRLIELENVLSVPSLTFEPTITPIIPEPTDLPDLAIINITSTLYTNYINFEITIQNIGTVVSTETTLNEIVVSVFSNSVIVPALEPEETFVTNVQHFFNPDGLLVNYTLLVEINPNRSLIETTYLNNSGSATVIANQNWPGTPGTPGVPGTPPEPGLNSYAIVHAHNPEGKELAQFWSCVHLSGFLQTPSVLSQHGVRQIVFPGTAYDNGILFNGVIVGNSPEYLYFTPGTTTNLIYTVNRTSVIPLNFEIIQSGTLTFSDFTTSDGETYYYENDQIVIKTYYYGYHLLAKIDYEIRINTIETYLKLRNYYDEILESYPAFSSEITTIKPIPMTTPLIVPSVHFSQYKKTGYIANVSLFRISPPSSATIISGISDGYYIKEIIPINATHFGFNIGTFICYNSGEKETIKELSGILEDLKLSNVPYDITKAGF